MNSLSVNITISPSFRLEYEIGNRRSLCHIFNSDDSIAVTINFDHNDELLVPLLNFFKENKSAEACSFDGYTYSKNDNNKPKIKGQFTFLRNYTRSCYSSQFKDLDDFLSTNEMYRTMFSKKMNEGHVSRYYGVDFYYKNENSN